MVMSSGGDHGVQVTMSDKELSPKLLLEQLDQFLFVASNAVSGQLLNCV